MNYPHEAHQAREFAEKAMTRILDEGLAPSPDIYELWYVYYAGISPEVTRALDILVSNRQKITEDRCRDLHTRFLSDARNEEMIRRAGDQVKATIKNVTGAVRDVKNATTSYSGTLEDVSRKMGSAKTVDEMRSLVTNVMGDTQKMLEHNHKLEHELEQSSTLMEELQRDLEQVRKEAMTDGLTGLANRKAFDAALDRVSSDMQSEQGSFTLLMVDIDHFKSFNDNYGHQVGDQVLRLVARTLIEGVKGKDIAARYGGEEFAIILPDTNLTAGVAVGNNLRKAVATKDVINRTTGEKLGRITMSVGVAEYINGENMTDLIERADAALYTAKHNGRNQVAAAPTPMGKRSTGA
ncbi:GGDEF domain-containing protein [Micavibrio aeruginosavorus]|uniref:diguanylate cyclase n=1 Tax=Micavibrio aeruginosavorus EPB TaxID=349215 RepID=M4VCD9_9BACT|nr:GGDEF domain-containing protein [Micavibrio aeruginosavorus]AGH96898.1 diguanylate cyclase (GGDEF domain) [Micavibrio aeruginosavorus EPB]